MAPSLPGLVIVLVLSAALLWYFHDRFWYPVDDGNYAHVAERVAAGEVLNGQVQDVHAGYINFLNAAAFRVFGVDLVSLRYPLVLAGLLQSAFVYWLVGSRGTLVGAVAAIGCIALGVVQFFSPTAHWYSGALMVATAAWMVTVPQGRRGRLFVAGVLVGTIVLFRQLSGVWVGMGVLALALCEESDEAGGLDRLCSRVLTGGMLVVLAGYAVTTREPLGALMVASPPAAFLVWMLGAVRTSNRATISVTGHLAAGAAVAATPLVVYHAAHGSFSSWVSDTTYSAAALTTLDFFGQVWYAGAVVAGLTQLLTPTDPIQWMNGWYWVVLPLLPLINGIGIVRHLRRHGTIEPVVLPILAAFYAVVSIHYQIPIYLYYSAGICLAAILWQHAARGSRLMVASPVAATALIAVALVSHAGQSHRRSAIDILHGTRRPIAAGQGLERASLKLDTSDRDTYGALVSLIRRDAPAGASILALPSNAELYFLADRRNPFRFYNTALGILTADDLRDALHLLSSEPPVVITFRPDDKYNTPASLQIMEQVRRHYDHVETIAGIEVYRHRPASVARADD